MDKPYVFEPAQERVCLPCLRGEHKRCASNRKDCHCPARVNTWHVPAPEKPLFIPLHADFFHAFESGLKKVEYRPHGKRWNSATCRIGRAVVLSRGYGKSARLHGEVVGFEVSKLPCATAAWVQCYGPTVVDVACIRIKVSGRVS